MGLHINIDKFTCYLLIGLEVIYYGQGNMIIKGGVIPQIALILILSISAFFLIKMLILNERFTAFMKFWLAFMLINSLYFLLTAEYSEDFGIYKSMLLNFLPFFPFYYFAKRKILTSKILICFFILIAPFLVLNLFEAIKTAQYIQGKEEVLLIASAYAFIGLLPFVLLIKNKTIAFSVFILLIYFMILTNKRGVIICGVLSMILLVYRTFHSSKGSLKSNITAIFFTLLIGYFGYTFYIENQFLLDRMNETFEGKGGTARENIFTDLYNTWVNSDNILNIIFGLGYNASDRYTIHVAHNDWIDMLGSFGLFGLVLYLVLFGKICMKVFEKNWNKNKKIILYSFVFCALITSLTSRWYISTFSFMNVMILPYLLVTNEDDI